MLSFPLGRVAGPAAPKGFEIPHGQQQSQIVLVQGWRRSHATYPLDDLCICFPAGVARRT